jgi:hemolysin activation/secretion protein
VQIWDGAILMKRLISKTVSGLSLTVSLLALTIPVAMAQTSTTPPRGTEDFSKQIQNQVRDLQNNNPQDRFQIPGEVIKYNQNPDGTEKKDTKTDKEAPLTPDIDDKKLDATENIDPSLKRKIMIQDIVVEGNTLLTSSEMNKVISQYEGKEESFVDLREMADKLTQIYRDKGYITSKFYIPPQTIKDGVVTVKASEGLVGQISLSGNKYFGPWAINNRINLTPGEPFRVNDLRQSMYRINSNPDLKIKSTLMAGKDPGTTDIQIEAKENFPVHLTGFYDNLGRRLIGTQRGGVTVASNNFFGLGDRINNTMSWSGRSFGVTNHYEVPLGKTPLRMGFDYSHSRLKLGKEFEELKVRGYATYYSPYISADLYQSDRYKVSIDVPFDFVNTRTTILGEQFQEDRIRLLRPSLNFEEYDSQGNTFWRNEFGVGMNLFGATLGDRVLNSRAEAGSKFFRWTTFLTRTQRLPLGTYGIFRTIAQLTPDRLHSSQQVQVGGAFTVRGYKEGRLIGDNALVTSAEWRIPAYIFPASWTIPKTNVKLRENIQFVGFTDFGAVWTNRPVPGVGASDYVLGAGFGIRARLTQYMVARVDMGFPLLRQAPDNNRPRLHFGLQGDLF